MLTDGKTCAMLLALLPLLRCPFCAAGPVSAERTSGDSDERIDNGTLVCAACGRTTEVVDRVWQAMGDHTWSKTLAQISNVTPPTAQIYERLWRVRSLSLLSGRSFPNEEELHELTDALRPEPGKVFVDVACSEGFYARALASRGATVVAIDHSRPFLRRVIHRSGNLPVVAVRAMAQHLPIVSGGLDGAAMGASLNEIGDQTTAVAEMARVVRPGGAVFSMSLTTATTRFGRVVQRVLAPAGITVPTADATVEMFEGAGLRVDSRRLDRIVLRVAATEPLAYDGSV